MARTKHGGAAVLDLHDLVAAHVTGLDQAEGIPHAQWRGDTKITLREHADSGGARRARERWGLEGLNRLEHSKGDDSSRLHRDY